MYISSAVIAYLFSQIKSRASQIRGEVKYKARSLVSHLYGIQDLAIAGGTSGKRRVREATEALLDSHSFLYEARPLLYIRLRCY